MGRVFACTDFHGAIKNYERINSFLKEDDKVYFLGDAADRGEHGWLIIKKLVNNPKWIWILGNHDEMLAKRLLYMDNDQIASLHDWNGGSSTWEDVENDIEAGRVDEVLNIANYISALPKNAIYFNKDGAKIYMSHSGFIGKDPEDAEDLVWDRTHFITPISKEDNTITYVIHGHTPIPYLIEELENYNEFFDTKLIIEKCISPRAYWYLNHTKCDLDCLTIQTGTTVLLDLDTFEEIIFGKD